MARKISVPHLATTRKGYYDVAPNRTRIQLTVSLPPDLVQAIDMEAHRQQRSRSQIVEFATLGYIKSNDAAAAA